MNKYDIQIQVAGTDELYIFKSLTPRQVDEALSAYRYADAEDLIEITDVRNIHYYFQKRHIIMMVVRESPRNE